MRLAIHVWVLVVILVLPVAAVAQDDITLPRPVIMLGIDTSGSMESLADGNLPVCSGVVGTDQANRFNIALSALTGSFASFTCDDIDRNTLPPTDIDYGYTVHHYAPSAAARASQVQDGVLDTYRERIKFGLMTFDTWGGGPNYPDPNGHSPAAAGMWSYGHNHRYQCFPDLDGDTDADCAGWDYQWDAGARDKVAGVANGGMVSVGRRDDQASLDAVNSQIQTELLTVRPFGATPLAAMIDDIRFYFMRNKDVLPKDPADSNPADDDVDIDEDDADHDSGPGMGQDLYGNCRPKFGLLFTDGIANVDARPFCDTYAGDGSSYGCTCPYEPAPQEAAELAAEGIPVFVIGYALELTDLNGSGSTDDERLANRRSLWDIAEQGDTAESCPLDSDLLADPPTCPTLIDAATNTFHMGAIFVDCDPANPAACRQAVATAFSRVFDAIGAVSTSRTLPTFSSSTGGAAVRGQDQFDAFFTISSGFSWAGHLNRSRYVCSGATLTSEPFDAATDSFDEILNNRASARRLYTFQPAAGVAALRGPLTSAGGATEAFTVANVTAADLSVASTAERDAVVAFVHGDPAIAAAGALRTGRRMGDIYHSAPVAIDPPEPRFGSPSYEAFQIAHLERKPAVFVGTNDGVLHVFDSTAEGADAGSEMWGFVAPYHLPVLKDQMPAAHNFYVDGTITVTDLLPVFRQGVTPAADGSEWRTVVVYGMRQGGNAYVALDVTESLFAPSDPRFAAPTMLWQFTDANMGLTYGGAQIARVFVQLGGESAPAERAVAVLVGGAGTLASASACDRQSNGYAGLNSDMVRCWESTGRDLWILDLMTGDVLRHWGPSTYAAPADSDNPFDSPLIGTPAIYLNGFDTTMKRIYVGDADGTIWRIQTDDADPDNWSAAILHDLFHDDATGLAHEPSSEQPALSTNSLRQVVVVAGSGDSDNLSANVQGANRVVSVTEQNIISAAGVNTGFTTNLNWEISMPSDEEKVTGPITITDSIAYFTSFIPGDPSGADLCNFGYARLWGVDFLQSETPSDPASGPIARLFLDANGDPTDGNEQAGSDQGGRAEDLDAGTVLYGVQATRRPTCVDAASTTDPLGITRQQISAIAPGAFELVAHLPDNSSAPPAGSNIGGTGGPGRIIEIRQQGRAPHTRIDSWGALIE